jgi:hypothetical protein
MDRPGPVFAASIYASYKDIFRRTRMSGHPHADH